MNEQYNFNKKEGVVWRTYMQMSCRLLQMMDQDMRNHSGLTNQEFEVLLNLIWHPKHTLRIQDLTKVSLLTKSGMTRLLTRLEKMKLVEKTSDRNDARGKRVVITSEGKKKFYKAKKAHIAFVRKFFLQHLTDSDLDCLMDFGQRIISYSSE